MAAPKLALCAAMAAAVASMSTLSNRAYADSPLDSILSLLIHLLIQTKMMMISENINRLMSPRSSPNAKQAFWCCNSIHIVTMNGYIFGEEKA